VYDDTYYNDGQIGVWKQARLSVWKPNRCSAKNKNILKSLVAVIHKNKRSAAGNSQNVVHPWANHMPRQIVVSTPVYILQFCGPVPGPKVGDHYCLEACSSLVLDTILYICRSEK